MLPLPNEKTIDAAGRHVVVSRHIVGLQVLRGLAAVSVVFHHTLRAVSSIATIDINQIGNELFKTYVNLLAFGVDIFFILSGFLMIHIAGPYILRKRSIWEFFVQRIVRIWPLYALVTSVVLGLNVISTFRETGALNYNLSPIRLLGFAFVPSFNSDGLLQPIVGVGWTLSYEFLYYLACSVSFLVLRIFPVVGVVSLLTTAWLIGVVLPNGTIAHVFLSNTILFEFIIGAFLARIFIFGVRIPALLSLALGVAGLLIFAAVPNESALRLFARGLPCALIFYAFLMLERAILWPVILKKLGDYSYAIYLIHITFMYQSAVRIYPIAERILGVDAAIVITVIVSATVAIGAGVCLSIFIEQPITGYLRRKASQRVISKGSGA